MPIGTDKRGLFSDLLPDAWLVRQTVQVPRRLSL
jgi:hypothetical protein